MVVAMGKVEVGVRVGVGVDMGRNCQRLRCGRLNWGVGSEGLGLLLLFRHVSLGINDVMGSSLYVGFSGFCALGPFSFFFSILTRLTLLLAQCLSLS
jgi:hypothetical protein